MNSNLLIDALVRQTTVLIAQLSTAAGLRSPLAHVADQVFLELSRELEAQGLGRRVVADMFGMLLRGYQKKVQRLTESSTVRDKSLWQAVLEFVTSHEDGVTRGKVLDAFRRDDEEAVGSVLHDLRHSGLVLSMGNGRGTLYRAATEADRRTLLNEAELTELVPMIWAMVFHHPGISLEGLLQQMPANAESARRALLQLKEEGRVTSGDWQRFSELHAEQLVVPVGAEVGWEAAVFDHFQAMATAIAAKVQRVQVQCTEREAIGGATLRFETSANNPYADEVFSLLEDTRHRLNELWQKVQNYNERHPIPANEAIQTSFYFGQSVREPSRDGE